MIKKLAEKLFGTHSSRELKHIMPIVDKIEALGDEYSKYTDAQLRAKTDEFKARLAKGETLDDILPEAFANVREAATRVLGERHYRVQLIGGIILHQGRIAEMRTGEGKTLVSTLPAYLNALTGNGVHIVTVNDYLAKRDSEWMGKVYRFLGLTVGLIIHDIEPSQRKSAYAADITYGTNNELGFDYLRDNMAVYKHDLVQRGHAFAIVDEVDSILIDEARTPLIISGTGEQASPLYGVADKFAAMCKVLRVKEIDAKEEQDDIDADYIVDEKARTAVLTPKGVANAEKYFNVTGSLTDSENATLLHHINQAIKARGVMRKDIDYVIRDGEIIIVDEFTGRLMYGRRYNEGLHQAIEAKENVKVARESKTLATITFQNFFRLYKKLSGMTGTALTEEEEFRHIYGLDVVEIPTNRPVARQDMPDQVYQTKAAKNRAVVRTVKECREKGQPVLIGTTSIEESEALSKILKANGIAHEVLNAKYHDKEADIIAQAGKLGAVTIATNMAGRGTDIKLGGNSEYLAKHELSRLGYEDDIIAEAVGYAETNDERINEARAKYRELYAAYDVDVRADAEKVRAAGGLYILGTERHESRRIDNQLRGRAGRQGDPGTSMFLLSMEDDLMRLFGTDRISGMMASLGLDEDTPIDQKILSGAIENAQKKVESRNFEVRKHVLEYDDVMNTQRNVIYGQRKQVLDGENLSASIKKMIETSVTQGIDAVLGGEDFLSEKSQIEQLKLRFEPLMCKAGTLEFTDAELNDQTKATLKERLLTAALEQYAAKEAEITSDTMREVERVILLRNVDRHWMDHIDAMHELRQGIGLRAFAQHDPVIEYKREGFDMFEEMITAIREDTVRQLYTVRLRNKEDEPKREQVAKPTTESAGDQTLKKQPVKKAQKVGRNDPCPCGSGKKYKHCCGQ